MFSFVNETVFAPFAGSGITTLAAKSLDRNSIGYEINSDFFYIKEKLEVHQQYLNGTTYNVNDLGVSLSGRAFRSNLFSFLKKGFPLQSLTQANL